jgi:enoyl-CoA hydratase/carnithine racemase
MLVTGDFISAEEALEKGLVNKVASPEVLDAAVEVLVSKILSKPSVALAMGKELFYKQIETGLDAAYGIAANTMACNMMESTALEGVQAFLEKRQPNW